MDLCRQYLSIAVAAGVIPHSALKNHDFVAEAMVAAEIQHRDIKATVLQETVYQYDGDVYEDAQQF